MKIEKKGSKPLINYQFGKSHFNSDKYLNELQRIYENEFIIIFSDILILTKKEFFDNINSRIKNLLSGKFNIEIHNNEKLNTSLNSYFKKYEQKYNIYYDELNQFLNNYKKSPKNGYKDNRIKNFRKHCWKTDDYAIHKCLQKNKIGKFIPLYESINGNISESRYNKNTFDQKQEKEKKIKYVLCIDCHKAFFSNKFINYCNQCQSEYYSSILYKNENEFLFPAKWENSHCELNINQQANCPQCKGLFYVDIKYNILKCLKCKMYRAPKNIERICKICKLKFTSDALIYNPLEKEQLNDTINEAIIKKTKARPKNLPCCNNINIFTTQFYHSNNCRGLIYLSKYNKDLIIFCSECKKVYYYDKFIWTCPICNKEFKSDKVDSNTSTLSFRNEFEIPRQNIYNKNTLNSNISSSRITIYDNNSYNGRYLRRDKKSDSSIINNLRNNLSSERNVVTNDNNNHKYKRVNRNEIKVNIKNITTNDNRYNDKKLRFHYKNISQKKPGYKLELVSNNKFLDSDSRLNPEKIIYYNKSESNLFDIKVKKDYKIFPSKNNLQNYKNNLVSSDRRIAINNKTEENEKNQDNNKSSNLIFKRSKYIKYNISLNEQNLNSNLFKLRVNKNNNNDDKNKNNNTITNLYNYTNNYSTNKPSSSSYIFGKNELNTNKNKILEIQKIKKKEIIKIQNNKIIQSSRLPNYNNPLNKIVTSKYKLKDNFIKNFSTIGIKEESKIEEKEKEAKKILEYKTESNNNQKVNINNKYINKIIDNKKIKENNKIRQNKNNDKKEKEINYYIKNGFTIRVFSPKRQEIAINEIKSINSISPISPISTKIETSESVKKIVIDMSKLKNNKIKRIEQNKSESEFKKININKHLIKKDNNSSSSNNNNNNNNKNNNNNNNNKKNNINYYNNDNKNNNQNNNKNNNNKNNNNNKINNNNKSNNNGVINNINNNNEKGNLSKEIELEKQKFLLNKPEDIIEHNKIDYRKDIAIEDPYLKSHRDLYDKMQHNLKQMVYRSHLPLFSPEAYLIEKKIGEGTNGAIYKVINKKSQKRYAMKKLMANSLIALKYLIKEFDLVYDVIHPNILSVYGMNIKCFDSNTFSLCVLMDLGETDWELEITDHYNSYKYYTEEELISILKQLTSALLYLQKEKKIAHRDIKPENILIFKNKVYKLGDFGEAKAKDNNKLNTLRGTDIYMSPILYNGLKLSKEDVIHNIYKSDVFSLGYSFLYAASLDHRIINEIRDLEDAEKIKNILYRMMKPRYSDNFIDIILQMINLDEKTRIDFIGLDKLIKEKL